MIKKGLETFFFNLTSSLVHHFKITRFLVYFLTNIIRNTLYIFLIILSWAFFQCRFHYYFFLYLNFHVMLPRACMHLIYSCSLAQLFWMLTQVALSNVSNVINYSAIDRFSTGNQCSVRVRL